MDLPRPAVPGRRRGWNHPAGWAGMVEAGLALVLLVIEVAAQLHDGNLLHLAVAIALCAGAAASGWRPRTAALVTCAALTVSVVWGDHWSASLYAPLVTVLGCVLTTRTRTAAGTTVWCWAWLTGLTITRTADTSGRILVAFVWAALFALPWVAGLSVTRLQDRQRDQLLADVQAQRLDLAAELHDTIAHDLAIVVMSCETALLEHPDTPDHDTLRQIGDTARRSSHELRHLMDLLQVGTAQSLIALPTALDEATTLLAHHGHTLAITTTPGDPLPPPVSDLAARIVREGAHNIVRHAPAHTTAELAIDRTPTTLDLTLTNPCTPGTTATPGIGLSGIIRRVEAHGGTCTITTHDSHWTLAAHLPAH